jgi:hypothetical protein
MHDPLFAVIEGLDAELCPLDELVLRDETYEELLEEAMLYELAQLEKEDNHGREI